MIEDSAPSRVPQRGGAGLGYRPALDGVRGIAILTVMFHHLRTIRGGYLGVDVFFVLSGFLITAILLNEWDRTGSISLKRFYLRRALRLLPALVAVLIVWALRKVFFESAPVKGVLQAALAVLFYSSNWLIAFGVPVYGLTVGPRPLMAHSWSLAIEEQFYLLWPAVLALLLRLKTPRRYLLLVPLVGAVLSATIRGWLWGGGATWARLWMGADSHADPILIGCAVGLLGSWKEASRKGALALRLLAASSVLPFLCFAAAEEFGARLLRYGMLTFLAISVGGLILTLVKESSFPFGIFEFPPLVWVGRRSYGLYLWHPLVFVLVGQPAWPRLPNIIVGLSVSFLVAFVSYELVEWPFLRMKARY
jgi:peptidoglycan/LPS O-acetylase OafA/YrhL